MGAQPRHIIHLDADAFFASVEQAADKRLRGRAMAVGGQRRGIIASASYEARARGIVTAMPTSRALKLCPDLTVVPGHFDLYERFSDSIFGLCEDLTPWVERASIDEGYLDLGGIQRGPLMPPDPVDLQRVDERGPRGAAVRGREQAVARAVRQLDTDIHGWLKITVSSGIAGNKLVAGVASKLRKPHGFVAVPRGREAAFLAPLPVRRLPGIGPKATATLQGIGVQTIGQLIALGPDGLRPFFQRETEGLLDKARGIDTTPLVTERADARSYGQQETFDSDIGDFDQVDRIAKRMIDQLMPRLRKERVQARTLTLRIRYTDMEEKTAAASLSEPSDLEDDFYAQVRPLLHRAWLRRVHLRLVGVRFSQVYPVWEQPLLFDDPRDRRRNLVQAADRLNQVLGPGRTALRRACHLLDGTPAAEAGITAGNCAGRCVPPAS
ncbi:MAG: DNA polymerase Y family protein [Opitutales bacterium]